MELKTRESEILRKDTFSSDASHTKCYICDAKNVPVVDFGSFFAANLCKSCLEKALEVFKEDETNETNP